ncbi:MAG TPA: hypothetical protein VKU92_00160 [Acidimicrobiales bacterium]|nr:hypothetical protein [Acidimicrobiales bacterium]
MAVAVVVVAAVGLGLGLGLGSGSPSGPRGRTGSTEPPGVATGGTSPTADSLAGISCGQPGVCIAVGNEERGPRIRSLAERSGTGSQSWRIVATPPVPGASLDQLAAVSCPSGSRLWCIAVGTALTPNRHGIAEVYSGGSWRLAAHRFPTGTSLSGVSCSSVGRCVAVGALQHGLGDLPFAAVLGDGRWSTSATLRRSSGSLASVSCGASCVAVGQLSDHGRPVPLVEALRGSSWQVVPSALPAGASGGGILSSVSCPPGGPPNQVCVAVGVQYDRSGAAAPLVEQGAAGRRWSPLALPQLGSVAGGALLGVSCTSAGSCVAVGSRRTAGAAGAASLEPLVLTESGGAWSLAPRLALGSSAASLSAVSCSGGLSCRAVGSALARPGRIGTLVVSLDRGRLVVVPSASPGLAG